MLLMTTTLDREVPVPLYFQLKNLILTDIKNQDFKEGDTIPTEMEIAEYYQISRSTVRQAMAELVKEGWLFRRGNKGTCVTSPEDTSSYIRAFEPFYQQINRFGKEPRTELIDLSVIVPDEKICKKMKLTEGQKIISLFRRRFADDVPMVTFQNFIPYELCSFILSYDFTTHSLYELLSSNPKTKIVNTNTIVSAACATAQDVSLLGITKDAPVLCFNNTAVTEDGTVVDFAYARYRGDLNKFEYDAKP